MSGLDLHTIRIVRAVAEHGSITAAAAELGYSQPALSQHLRRAERRLGVPLLLRTGRGVQLTEPGRVVARHSTTVLAALAAAEDELSHLADRTTGTVRLAGFPSASSTIVPAMMALLKAQHPGLQLIYTEAEPPEALTMLTDGAIDLALTFSYPGDPADPHDGLVGIRVIKLFSDPAVLVLPAGHPSAMAEVSGLAEFDSETWIGGCPLCRGHLLASCSAQGFSPRIVHATDNSVAVLGLVAAGVGIALQPKLALEPLEIPAGTSVRDLPGNDRQVQVVCLSGALAVPAIGAAVETLRTVTAHRR
ncbi:MAG: LysR family transcriptional regulator [Actinobacteria bacterium HGW-Actinobacteria-2]|nr:MAG: LysR family transcriptional regulator [Actinobacteria bacterium HGW-Actinobacteria-2]